ncbi:sigma-70 family RNA polymerase sigma factor [Romboutsia sp.]|uniref:sigma-70 family RNA polymerase sigma factor n=1 Tax=Romboutsia sp. TaxID=1965302 RepID=UPI003F3CEEE6
MKITEENFILKLKQRDDKALEYVIDNYGWIIKSIVKKNLYNLEMYQDECINDILLGLWNNIESFDEERSTFKNWIAGISKYKTIDYRRKYLKNLQYEDIDNMEIKTEDNTCKELIENEISQELENMLSHLKDKDKELFLKLYVEEKDIDTISEETGMNRDVIYNRVSRSKKKLRDIFKTGER